MNPDVRRVLRAATLLVLIALMAVLLFAWVGAVHPQDDPALTPFPQGAYTIAGDVEVLIVFTHDPIVADKKQTLIWNRGGFDKGQSEVIVKLVKRLTDIVGITNVAGVAYRLDIRKAKLYSWDDLIPKVLEVIQTSELTAIEVKGD